MVHLAFAKLGVHHVVGTCDPRNAATARVLQTLECGTRVAFGTPCACGTGRRESDVYGLLEDEWREENPADELMNSTGTPEHVEPR